MNKYVVGILNFFDNNNLLFQVEADTDSEAMVIALMHSVKDNDVNAKEYYATLKSMEPKDIQSEMFNGDVSISLPLKIN